MGAGRARVYSVHAAGTACWIASVVRKDYGCMCMGCLLWLSTAPSGQMNLIL
jgi:hypothetical protein